MPSKFELWARAFRKAARADGYQAITAWLEEQGWTTAAEVAPKAVGDTICLVELLIRRGDTAGLLPLQVYDPAEARACYILTFQGGEHQYVRLYCNDLAQVDLVEIYNDAVGFQAVTVDHVVLGGFEEGERDQIEELVRADFSHDYEDDDIELTFAPGPCVHVEVNQL